MRVTRFAAVFVVVAALFVGCRQDEPTIRTDENQPILSTTPPSLPPEEWVPSSPEKWVPADNEIEPRLKKAATDFLSVVFSYDSGGGTLAAAKARLADISADPALADKAAPLLDPDARAMADIIYPQMGGLVGDRASVMVVARLRWSNEKATLRTEVRTIDVRLVLREGSWHVEDLASLGGDPVPLPKELSEPALRVLNHPNIDLPDSARWDIAANRVRDPVLTSLASLADEHRVGVAVLSTGHPIEVFGSTRMSNHIPGRAVDVWLIDRPIIDQRESDGPLLPVLQKLMQSGVTELGGPFDLDGPNRTSFTNLVHQDHLHIGYHWR